MGKLSPTYNSRETFVISWISHYKHIQLHLEHIPYFPPIIPPSFPPHPPLSGPSFLPTLPLPPNTTSLWQFLNLLLRDLFALGVFLLTDLIFRFLKDQRSHAPCKITHCLLNQLELSHPFVGIISSNPLLFCFFCLHVKSTLCPQDVLHVYTFAKILSHSLATWYS